MTWRMGLDPDWNPIFPGSRWRRLLSSTWRVNSGSPSLIVGMCIREMEPEQRDNVGMTAARSFLLHRVRAIVRPSALTFRGGDQKIVADHSKSAGIPT